VTPQALTDRLLTGGASYEKKKSRSWEVEKLGWAENQLHASGFSELPNFIAS
jgi:hypothetical protein